MDADHDYDAVVVGARCAGAATAMLLARAGLRVALVDRMPVVTDTLSTHALMRGGVLQLRRWGLLDRVVAAGTPPVRGTVFHYGTVRRPVLLKPGAGVDALYAPRRTVLDPMLLDAAAEAGADVLLGVSVTDVARRSDGRVSGVDGHDRHGSDVRLRARVTVGADGLRSIVARSVDAPIERVGDNATALIYTHVTGLASEGHEWYLGPGVSGGLIATNDNQTCVWAGAPSRRFRTELRADIPAAFGQLLAETSPELAARVMAVASGREPLRSFPGVPGYLRRPWGPGWALVGDAGYFKDPITAHGMTDALRDAELLAGAIVDAATGEVPEAAALGRYHRTRNRLSHALFAVSDRIAGFAWDMSSVEADLKALSAAMADEVDHLAALPAAAVRTLA
jgi:2-polyprenyl-6-methoxyphenol hydroxylase-like FAD-dependent oxidoreductase